MNIIKNQMKKHASKKEDKKDAKRHAENERIMARLQEWQDNLPVTIREQKMLDQGVEITATHIFQGDVFVRTEFRNASGESYKPTHTPSPITPNSYECDNGSRLDMSKNIDLSEWTIWSELNKIPAYEAEGMFAA